MIKTLPNSLIESAKKIRTHIDVDGELKHRYNSNGDLIHPSEDGIRNFHRWFGNSTATDSSGRPQVFHHGTDAKFDEFKKQEGTVSTIFGSEKVERNGHFFTTDKDFAKEFSKNGNTMQVYLRMHKPFDLSNGVSVDMYQTVEKHGFNPRWLLSNHLDDWERFDGEDGTAFVDTLKKAGHDSSIIQEPSANGLRKAHIVFQPNQIKSAEHNTGDYSVEDNVIHA